MPGQMLLGAGRAGLIGQFGGSAGRPMAAIEVKP